MRKASLFPLWDLLVAASWMMLEVVSVAVVNAGVARWGDADLGRVSNASFAPSALLVSANGLYLAWRCSPGLRERLDWMVRPVGVMWLAASLVGAGLSWRGLAAVVANRQAFGNVILDGASLLATMPALLAGVILLLRALLVHYAASVAARWRASRC